MTTAFVVITLCLLIKTDNHNTGLPHQRMRWFAMTQVYGGMRMNAYDYWQLFMDTGAPEMYLKYKAMMMEDKNVSDDPGGRPQSYGLQ